MGVAAGDLVSEEQLEELVMRQLAADERASAAREGVEAAAELHPAEQAFQLGVTVKVGLMRCLSLDDVGTRSDRLGANRVVRRRAPVLVGGFAVFGGSLEHPGDQRHADRFGIERPPAGGVDLVRAPTSSTRPNSA